MVVRFTPEKEGISSIKVVLGCDNQTNAVIGISGQGNMVELTMDQMDDVNLKGSCLQDFLSAIDDSKNVYKKPNIFKSSALAVNESPGQNWSLSLNKVIFANCVPNIAKSRNLSITNQT